MASNDNFGSHQNSPAVKKEDRRKRKENFSAWTSVFFIFAILSICISPNLFQAITEIPAGTVWTGSTIITPYELKVEDKLGVEDTTRRLVARAPKVFVYHSQREEETFQRINAVIATAEDAASGEDPLTTVAVEMVRNRLIRQHQIALEESTVEFLTENAGAEKVRSDLKVILHQVYGVRGVTTDKNLYEISARSGRLLVFDANSDRQTTPTQQNLFSYPEELFSHLANQYLPLFGISSEAQNAYLDILRQVLRPNIVYDRTRTDRHLERAIGQIPSHKILTPNTVVARPGQTLTDFQTKAIFSLEETQRYYSVIRAVGGALAVALVLLFTGVYLRRFKQDYAFTSRNILLVALPVVIAISLGRAILNLGGGYFLGAFVFPAALIGMLAAPLFDGRFASLLVVASCFLFAVATDLAYPYALVGMVGGFTAIAGLSSIKERGAILKTGIYVAMSNCAMAVILSLILTPSAPEFQAGVIAGIFNGIACYMLAVALLPVFEYLFQITTDIRLMELVASHHPLLKEMQEKAPGTWQHSLNVASLAEAAAESVGANYLLIRTGAYFHDVGKIVKPKYFTENQLTPEDKKIHSRLSPYMSTLLIRNHVKDGVELARKHRLPKKVVDFIPQHHGNTLIKYFYVQALKKAEIEGSDDIIHEDEFRYPGPKPQTIETAILMLADTVEATATAMFRGGITDEDDVRRMVRDSIRDKFEDGQFDECPMTFRDLHVIQEAFVRNLVNRFHQRVKYPTAPKPAPQSAGQSAKDEPAADKGPLKVEKA